MSDSMLLGLGIFVFTMLCIGLALTIWEFKHGQPHEEQKMVRRSERGAEEIS